MSDLNNISPFPKDRSNELVGTVLSERYEILSTLGKGGMGVVYKGRHKLVDRFVAIKVLRSGLLEDDVTKKRFQQEAKAAGALSHPNLISVFDYGFGPEGEPYLVMDFLEGESLADSMDSNGVVSLERFQKIMAQVCKALSYIHKRGIVHRDLKPSNIMLVPTDDDPDFVKVVDFGIAKVIATDEQTQKRLTETGQSFGSPPYMSPEQCIGKEVDERSDVYALGCVMFEMLTGTPPIVGDNPLQTLFMHCNNPPKSFSEANPDVHVPIELQKILMKALEKDPEKRWHSARELGDLIGKLSLPAAGGDKKKPDPLPANPKPALPPRLVPSDSDDETATLKVDASKLSAEPVVAEEDEDLKRNRKNIRIAVISVFCVLSAGLFFLLGSPNVLNSEPGRKTDSQQEPLVTFPGQPNDVPKENPLDNWVPVPKHTTNLPPVSLGTAHSGMYKFPISMSKKDNSLFVTFVEIGSPAADVLKENDQILSVDGFPVSMPLDVIDRFAKYDRKDQVNLKVNRDGQILTLSTSLAK